MSVPSPEQMRALQTRIHGFDHHPTAYTPQWMHTLAARLEGKAADNDREHAHDVDQGAATRALRATADQLEAVRAICDRALSVKLVGSTRADAAAAGIAAAVKNAIADSAPQTDAL